MVDERLKEFFVMCYGRNGSDSELEAFGEAIKTLTPKEEAVVRDYCSIDGTKQEKIAGVAKKYEISEEKVEEVISCATRRMRNPSRLKMVLNKED